MDDFDREYTTTAHVFGSEPEDALVRFADLIDSARPVLDVGCGQGRNSLFLAGRGLTVDALDPSRVAVEQVAREAIAEGLPIRTIHGTFQKLENADHAYSAMLVFGLIPVLERPQIEDLVEAVGRLLGAGGLLFITAFGTWDPDYAVRAAEWVEVDRNSFRSPGGRIRTYLESGELTALFPGFKTVHIWEGLGPEHRHGDGPLERHGMAEAVLERPSES